MFANNIKRVQACIDARGHHFQQLLQAHIDFPDFPPSPQCGTVCHHISIGLYPSLSAQRLSELTLPCVTVCHHISNGLYPSLSAQRLSELPLLCVTVCHHTSTGLYPSLSAQRLSERTLYTPFFRRDSPQWVLVSSFTWFLDHTQRPTTVGRTPMDEWSARRIDLYLTTHNTLNRQTSMPPAGFEPTIPAGERPQTYALDRAATGTGIYPLL